MECKCHFCEKRTHNCHATCEDYKEFAEWRESIRQKIFKMQVDDYYAMPECRAKGRKKRYRK